MPRLADIRFLLQDVLDAPGQLRKLDAFAGVDSDLMLQVQGEAAKFVAGRIARRNRVGDEVGCRFEAGEVVTPPGFREAYQAFWHAG